MPKKSVSKAADTPKQSIGRKGWLYLFGIGSGTGGLAIGSLDAAGICTDAGGITKGAIYTSAYLTLLMVAAAFTVPHTAKIAARFGIERTYRLVVALGSTTWLICGTLILAGVPGFPVLLCFAPIFGFTGGLSGVLAPIFSKAYIAGKDMAGAYARMSVISGIAWAIGSALGGIILNDSHPGVGIVLKGIFGIPFVVVLLKVRPAAHPTTPKAKKRAFPEMRERLSNNDELRRATMLRCGIALFAAPMASLIVPIVDALRQTPLLPGAGIIVAAMAVGQLASPGLVGRLSRNNRPQIAGASIAALASAGVLVAYGLVSALVSKRPELLAWCFIGLSFGGLRYAARALNIGAVSASGPEEDTTNLLQASQFAATLASPIGVLMWGFLINQASVEVAIFVGAAGMALVALASLRRASRPAVAV